MSATFIPNFIKIGLPFEYEEVTNIQTHLQTLTLSHVYSIEYFISQPDEVAKSKADLKAERRAKQEAQRAAKQAALEQKPSKPKAQPKPDANSTKPKEVSGT